MLWNLDFFAVLYQRKAIPCCERRRFTLNCIRGGEGGNSGTDVQWSTPMFVCKAILLK